MKGGPTMPPYFPTYFKYRTVEIPEDKSAGPNDLFYGVTNFVIPYTYLPYSPQRIKAIMLYDYGIELEFIHPGYKGNRYPGYVNKYRLIDYYYSATKQ